MISSISSNPAQSPDYTTTIRPHHGGHHHGGASKIASDIISEADTDGDGSISKSELSTMLTKKLGGSESADDISSQVDAIFKQVDTDGNGGISQSELTSAIKTVRNQQEAQGASVNATSIGTDNPVSALSALLGPPLDVGYTATGAATVSSNATTFTASA